MEEEISVSFEQFLQVVNADETFQDQIIIIEIDGNKSVANKPDDLLVRLDALCIVLVSKGELIITVDYLPYRVTQHMTLGLTHKHLLNSINVSHDARGYYVMFSKTLLKEMFPQFMNVPKEYLMNRRLSPIMKLDPKEYVMLTDVLERLRNNIRRKNHMFHQFMVMSEAGSFLMELTNCGMQQMGAMRSDYKATHNEELALKFMHLIVTRGKEWNEVSQYSTELCVTPVYLSRAIKAVSGKTVMEWINEARIAEAKILLRKPNMSIQEISEDLNFSDQSAFGKFFKKQTGLSPLEYRRKF
ncbi:AraC family transcriptional regulator [Bacteroides sp. 51]|uniref:helix-turn-helix domain-containing protein n=1 Tax=Bacteroides sp. 51 TaxID=2302938 RepID=UPI0013CF6DC7|nr:helix-turn-helix domain-containing protein [Bacteroides sp. 51]NDV84743.1 AraC family transcriptional regulator [Bacteroides sp. 51]